MTNQTAGRTILQQIGGAGRVWAMLGGKVAIIDNGLQIDFKGCRKANKVQIKLQADDTYSMTFYKFNRRTFDCPVVGERNGVFAGNLTTQFEQFTGLALRL